MLSLFFVVNERETSYCISKMILLLPNIWVMVYNHYPMRFIMTKLKLNKSTVSILSKDDLKQIDGHKLDAAAACWENLWTLYECDVAYTSYPN